MFTVYMVVIRATGLQPTRMTRQLTLVTNYSFHNIKMPGNNFISLLSRGNRSANRSCLTKNTRLIPRPLLPQLITIMTFVNWKHNNWLMNCEVLEHFIIKENPTTKRAWFTRPGIRKRLRESIRWKKERNFCFSKVICSTYLLASRLSFKAG